MKKYHPSLIIAGLLLILLASAALAQGSALLNAYESLYYYSLRIDDRFPTISPLSTTVQELEKEIRSGLRPDEARLVLGMVYQTTGDWEKAIENYQKASAALPENGSIHVMLGDVFRHQRRWEEAEAAYNQALDLEPFARAYKGLGLIRMEREEFADARAFFRAALDIAEEFLAARIGLGRALYYLDEDTEAIETLEIALGQDSRSITTNHYLSLLYERQGEAEKAAHAKQRAEELRDQQ